MKTTQVAIDVDAGPPHQGDADASTRHRVTSSLLEHGRRRGALAGRLGLTPAGIRRHLDALLTGGQVEAREQRVYGARGRGRPAKVFALTDAGRAGFYTAYDDLANATLGYLAEVAGPDAVTRFAEQRMAAVEARYAERLAAADPGTTPAQALAEALTDDGYVAATLPAGNGGQLCQHHCPVAHSPSSSRSCARSRPGLSPDSWAFTYRGSPPSPTATVSAPPTSRGPPVRSRFRT